MRDVRDAQMVARNSDGKLVRRPLSPHVQVYRWPLSMALSITHRVTGVGLGIGTLLLTLWLLTAATSENGFDRFQYFLGSAVGLFLLFCWTLSLVFHLLTGVRHLWMDTGNGFEETQYQNSAIAVLVGTGALTILIWVIGLISWYW
ncbi:MAG TPA: succinate dehydrogenase, cytochrome b556 subunit [Acetobacteraceae bacterium]|nr:succinate dehydrogenase, cytochrome b556 subunit [Acetobacteraceae bacterium]